MKAEPSQIHLTSQKAVIDITSFWTLWVISTSPNPDEEKKSNKNSRMHIFAQKIDSSLTCIN